MKKINDIIKDFREDNDFSQQDVADYLKVPRSTYGHYESEKSKVPIEIIIKLSNLYKITPNDLLGFPDNSTYKNISKINKLCKLIEQENINIDRLIEIINLVKNINN